MQLHPGMHKPAHIYRYTVARNANVPQLQIRIGLQHDLSSASSNEKSQVAHVYLCCVAVRICTAQFMVTATATCQRRLSNDNPSYQFIPCMLTPSCRMHA